MTADSWRARNSADFRQILYDKRSHPSNLHLFIVVPSRDVPQFFAPFNFHMQIGTVFTCDGAFPMGQLHVPKTNRDFKSIKMFFDCTRLHFENNDRYHQFQLLKPLGTLLADIVFSIMSKILQQLFSSVTVNEKG